jgi:hypothetical protein
MKIQPAVSAIGAVLVAVLTLVGPLPVHAQDSKTQPSPPPMQQTEFSQNQLESFASATVKVRDIRSKWQSQMQSADSAEKAKEFQSQANVEMVNAVEANGLTVETYNAIATAARSNPELANRITELLQKTH